MSHFVAPAVFATFLWWFSTGVIFYLNARAPRTFGWSMLGASVVLGAALYGIWRSAPMEGPAGAYLAFSCGVLIWGWHTMSYYMGVVTGPRRSPCPTDCRGWRHFLHAVETSIYHELAIIATVALLAVLTWGEPNRFGLWTFLVLWSMHVSAKLNVFLGVRNLNKEFIPDRLQYLTRFFRRRSMNLLFPFSVTIGTLVAFRLAGSAAATDATGFEAIGYTLLATLMALAVIEHWFMILPIPAQALWRWSLDPAPVAQRGEAESVGSTTRDASAEHAAELQRTERRPTNDELGAGSRERSARA